MKKKIITCVAAAAVIVSGLGLNVIIRKGNVEREAYKYIAAQGYSEETIKELNIEHHYINRLLGYNEWRISAVFKERDNLAFWFSYKNKGIFLEGVTELTKPVANKEDVIYYLDSFKDGTLLKKNNITSADAVDDENTDTLEPEEKSVNYAAQYIQGDWNSKTEYPQEYWVTDENELAGFISKNRNVSSSAEVKKYDKSFFETNDLLIEVFQEGSGSARHEVTDVKFLKDSLNKGKYNVQPEIVRFLPGLFTDDMAEWAVFIEISKEYGDYVSQPLEPVFIMGNGKSLDDTGSEKIGKILGACSEYLADEIKECVDHYYVNINYELPSEDNFVLQNENPGEGPYYIVDISTSNNEVSGRYVLVVNQNMEVAGEYLPG